MRCYKIAVKEPMPQKTKKKWIFRFVSSSTIIFILVYWEWLFILFRPCFRCILDTLLQDFPSIRTEMNMHKKNNYGSMREEKKCLCFFSIDPYISCMYVFFINIFFDRFNFSFFFSAWKWSSSFCKFMTEGIKKSHSFILEEYLLHKKPINII